MHPLCLRTALALCLPFWCLCGWLAPWLTLSVFGLACVAVGSYAVGCRKGVAL